jgi:hypothetical protein
MFHPLEVQMQVQYHFIFKDLGLPVTSLARRRTTLWERQKLSDKIRGNPTTPPHKIQSTS